VTRWATNTGQLPITLDNEGRREPEVQPGGRFDADQLHPDRLAALIGLGAVALSDEVPAPSPDSVHGFHGVRPVRR
jgi:hypothetical protein